MSTALRIIRPLPAAEQRLRALVLKPLPAGRQAELAAERRALEAEQAELERVLALRENVWRLRIAAATSARHADAVVAIIALVAERTGENAPDILSRQQTRELVWARHLVRHLMRLVTPLPLHKIASATGANEHGAVLYSLRAVRDRRDTEPDFDRMVKEIEAEFKPVKVGPAEAKP